VQRRSFPMQVPVSGKADIEADLIQGGQIRVCFDFWHEAKAANFSGWVRVEAFNSEGTLVGASIYGQSEPNYFTRQGTGGAYLNYSATTDLLWGNHMSDHTGDTAPTPGPAGGAGFDVNTTPGGTYPSFSGGQRAERLHHFTMGTVPTATWNDYPYDRHATVVDGYLLDANRYSIVNGSSSCADIYGFYYYYGGPARTWAGGWPTVDGVSPNDFGLKGSVDVAGWPGSGGGLYTIKIWAFDPWGFDNKTGTTDDWRMYAMASEITNVEVPWGGAVTVYTGMNDLASLRGTITWTDMFGNLNALPWAQLTASPGPAYDSYPAYATGTGLELSAVTGLGIFGLLDTHTQSSAGSYIMWVPAGTHEVSVSTSAFSGVWAPGGYSVVVSDGWVGGGGVALQSTGNPVPEVPVAMLPLALFGALAASVWLLRKKNFNTPVLIK